MNSKLILGTVQFGLEYGINNTIGKPTNDEVLRVVRYDQKYSLFTVFKDDLKEFHNWVALTHETDEETWPDDMPVGDYLDQRGISILVND